MREQLSLNISELSEQAQKDYHQIMKLRNRRRGDELLTPRAAALIRHPEIGKLIANKVREHRRKK